MVCSYLKDIVMDDSTPAWPEIILVITDCFDKSHKITLLEGWRFKMIFTFVSIFFGGGGGHDESVNFRPF